MPTCNSNLKVTIYLNDVAIVLVCGKEENEHEEENELKEENELVITINSRGIVEYNWIKPNYAKETYVHVSLKKNILNVYMYYSYTCKNNN